MYCHARNLLHMDVKPQNVLISLNKPNHFTEKSIIRRSYICKLCDFGSSLKIKDGKENVKGLVKVKYELMFLIILHFLRNKL